jgi:RecA-family ATPase
MMPQTIEFEPVSWLTDAMIEEYIDPHGTAALDGLSAEQMEAVRLAALDELIPPYELPVGDFSTWHVDGLNGAIAEAARTDDDDPLGDMATVAEAAAYDPPPREFLLEDSIPVGAAAGIFGDGGTGKTTIAITMAVAIERGIEVFGLKTSQAPVLGIFAEDDSDELKRRLKAVCASLGVQRDAVTGFHYQSRFGRENLLGRFDANGAFHSNELFARIRSKAIAVGARLIILDNVNFIYPDNINDPARVTRFVAALNGLAADINGAVLLLGHIAKAQGSQYAGTAAWSNACRSRMFFDFETAGSDGVSDANGRVLTRPKANYAARGGDIKLTWHQGAFILPDDLPADVYAEQTLNVQANGENERFMECLAKATEEQRSTSHSRAAGNYAPRLFARMTLAKGMGIHGFERAMERLLHLGRIRADQTLWQRKNRTWVTGIGPHSGCSQVIDIACTGVAQNGCTEPHTTTAQVSDIPCTAVAPHSGLLSKDNMGAATAAAAPIPESPESDSAAAPPGESHARRTLNGTSPRTVL